MKKIVFGLILGILLSSGVAYAAEMVVKPNAFPVIVNGDVVDVEAYNIDGYTFLKLRDFEKAGLIVKFNETRRQIEITSNQPNGEPAKEEDAMGSVTKAKSIPEPKVLENISAITPNKNGEETFTADGVKYITGGSLYQILYDTGNYRLSGSEGNVFITKINHEAETSAKILENMPHKMYKDEGSNSMWCFEYDYYVNTILPLIK